MQTSAAPTSAAPSKSLFPPVSVLDSRRNSTGQVKAPPPKPPQRTSSFRRKSGERVEEKESLQRAGSLRVKSQPSVQVQRFSPQPQPQTNPVIKTTGAVSVNGGTKQNPLLLPSKFNHEVKQSPQSQASEQNVSNSAPVSVQLTRPPPSTAQPQSNMPNGFAEFEMLLARQRERVEADEVAKSQTISSTHPSSNGPVTIHHQNFLTTERAKATTDDMDLPKKKAPPPPRRSSSFRSRKKYEGPSDHRPPQVVLRQHILHCQTESGQRGGSVSPSSTSPSTGQCRPSSAEYHLRRLSGADLSETVFC